MRLVYTPRSHFSRKVRLLADALGLEIELVDAGNAADAVQALFGPNPLMKVPTLVDDGQVVFESDHIAAWLVRRHDPDDRFGVLATDPDVLNLRAVMNGVMALEAELILAERTGLSTDHPRFDKMRVSIRQALDWLDVRAAAIPSAPAYTAFHFVSMWDHLALYEAVPRDAPRLRERRVEFDQAVAWQPLLAASAPPAP